MDHWGEGQSAPAQVSRTTNKDIIINVIKYL